MKIKYVCPKCGHRYYITSFWRWFFTPHFGASKFIRCPECNKVRLMHRWDGRRWLDWPTEKKWYLE